MSLRTADATPRSHAARRSAATEFFTSFESEEADEMVRELRMKPTYDDHRLGGISYATRCELRIERREQLVDRSSCAGEAVEECRLTRVRGANKRDR